jgi:hypothetical protein
MKPLWSRHCENDAMRRQGGIEISFTSLSSGKKRSETRNCQQDSFGYRQNKRQISEIEISKKTVE